MHVHVIGIAEEWFEDPTPLRIVILVASKVMVMVTVMVLDGDDGLNMRKVQKMPRKSIDRGCITHSNSKIKLCVAQLSPLFFPSHPL